MHKLRTILAVLRGRPVISGVKFIMGSPILLDKTKKQMLVINCAFKPVGSFKGPIFDFHDDGWSFHDNTIIDDRKQRD